MRIEKIIIENINSIEKAEISLSTGILANEPLFLITGETGSGKSTILDAITLALYDKSPRYENTQSKEKTENGLSTMQSTNNVLRKGTSDGKAEVWFCIGNDEYIATWHLHRTKSGKYETTNRRKLEVVKGEERIVLETKIDAVNQRVEELLGLTYEQFMRSVMLAQGQFSTFLNSNKRQQTEILEMLTGTEVYSKIAEIVGQHKNDANKAVLNAKDQYNRMADTVLPEAQLAELTEKLAKNVKLQEQTEADIKTQEQNLRNLENLDKLHLEIDNSKSQLADLQASYEKMLEEKSDLKKKADEIKLQIDEQSGKKAMFEQIPLIISLLKEVEEAEKKIADCEKEIESLKNQRTQKESETLESSERLKKAAEAQSEANLSYEKCNSELEKANLDKLNEDYNEHESEREHQKERKEKCQSVIRILKDYKFKQQFIDAKREELFELKYNFKECEADFSAKETVFKAKDTEYLTQKNMVDEYIKSLRATLKDGEPCPLCGSTSHQYHNEEVVNSLFKTIETAWKDARNEMEKAKDIMIKAENNVKLAEQIIDNEQKAQKNLNDELTKLCNGNPVYDLEKLEKGEKACDEKIAAEELIIKELNEKRLEAQKIQKRLQQLLQEKNKADEIYKTIENQCDKIKNEIADIDGKIKNKKELAEQTTNSRLEKFERVNKLIVNDKWQDEWHKSSEEFYRKLQNRADDWKQLNDSFAKIDSEIVKIDEIANGIKRIEGIDRVEEFKGKVATNHIDKSNLISGFSKVVFNLIEKSEQAKVIENQFGEESIDDSKAQTLRALTALTALRSAQTETITEIRAKLSLNVQNTASAQAAKDDLQAKSELLALWTQLANAIGTTPTDNFRDVAQAYTMRILLDQANYFLRKLSQRYELTCYDNSLAIMVMDKEMGGELRSASSLSGGETFLVSLALALGLASLNDDHLNIDMLFIDEGFGSLDGESLEMAVQALGNMQKFGKKVGIISHVDSLKERIPVQIQVTRRGKAASEVVIK
ncbi:MAG: AAA family ATPase [Bacteroidales bacterium]|nr:AAA family ATPase [Bacteroidales bacterium]